MSNNILNLVRKASLKRQAQKQAHTAQFMASVRQHGKQSIN